MLDKNAMHSMDRQENERVSPEGSCKNETITNKDFSRTRRFFGHLSRVNGLEASVIEWKMDGNREHRRVPLKWSEGISEFTKKSFREWMHEAYNNREAWRRIINKKQHFTIHNIKLLILHHTIENLTPYSPIETTYATSEYKYMKQYLNKF